MIIAPVVVPRNALLGSTGNCVSDLTHGSTSYVQYICQVIFDALVLTLTSMRLFRGADKHARSALFDVIWESQLMYFVAVTASNIINLIFFIKFNRSTESTMFATLGMAITAIFSSHVSGTRRLGGNAAPISEPQFRVNAETENTDTYNMHSVSGKSGVHVHREVVTTRGEEQDYVVDDISSDYGTPRDSKKPEFQYASQDP
ncbi:hypothetical protein FISHEDRAFT_55424 [Fistulina hepatica ATCC 64428]|uniref:Uncharacterized protein n=1 Tax=Fistulina hepatica ATCC 64428 TaxID=1128425 RepID=A0A0D7AMG6_9AGAR|nr:hypothetical protein FISHEDRAFT_55424 [Fistulina hepatica ATCC 64428]